MSKVFNPMAKDLRQPKYRSKVIPDKKKPKPYRKAKHKKAPERGLKFLLGAVCPSLEQSKKLSP